jgi:hypothetical protein
MNIGTSYGLGSSLSGMPPSNTGQHQASGGVYNMNGKSGQEDFYPNTTFIAKTEHMNVGPNIKSEPG